MSSSNGNLASERCFTAEFERITKGYGFYTYSQYTQEAPDVMLNIRFNYNNYKPDRRRNQDNIDLDVDNCSSALSPLERRD